MDSTVRACSLPNAFWLRASLGFEAPGVNEVKASAKQFSGWALLLALWAFKIEKKVDEEFLGTLGSKLSDDR